MTDKKEVKINAPDAEQTDASEEKVSKEAASDANEVGEAQAEAEVDIEKGSTAEAATVPEKELTEEEKLRVQVADLEDRLLRALADLDNYKKRSMRQFADVVRTANDKLLGEILEVADNFERALDHVDEATDVEVLEKGTRLIYSQIQDLLRRHEVTPIEAVGKPFDPNLHEAMMQVESEEFGEGVVAVEMSKGYKIGDRVLRHSKVGVSTG
jgi:molecular chaperone GrpE